MHIKQQLIVFSVSISVWITVIKYKFFCASTEMCFKAANICLVFDTWCSLAIISLNKKHLNYFQPWERKVRNHVCSVFCNMIVLDWLMGTNILEDLDSFPTALKVEAASSLKHLYLSCASLQGVMSQKTGIFVRTNVRTSDLADLIIALFSCTEFLY